MQTVIGLGKAGCSIADALLSVYPQYQIKKIDVGLKRPKQHLVLSIRTAPNFMNQPRYRKVLITS